ncbi:MFS transporter [Aneurinibacillus thermoaerophilus]|uniref:MFS transporter n=1 Tax=Aneurinibacillus thermoaerophilus TaxID=143495 RepID=UPI002E1A9274|nr:MFS transporter [Aneurinibacillus thermoaerophilus]MED0762870.1 MFS transporter [Aneurinibacillus thermoaerophilus]
MEAKQGTSAMIAIAFIPLVMVLGNSMLVPVLPTMKAKLGLSQFQTSLMITLFSLAAGIIIPVVGYLSDRFSRKWVIVPSLILYGIGGIMSGLAAWLMENSYTMILIGRIVQGIGAAGTAYVAMALIGDLYSGAQESKALGIIESSNGLGKILSPIIGSLIALVTWYAVFFKFPVLCFAVAAYVWFGVKEKKKMEEKSFFQYLKALKQIFKNKGRWLIPAFFVGSAGLFILFGVLFYLSDVLEETFKIDGVLKGSILAIPLFGMVVTAYITGAKIKQNKPLIRKVMVAGLVILTGSMFGVAFFKQIYLMIGLLTLGSIGTGLLLPCLNTLITGAVEKAERGMITSLYGSVRFLGVAFGPPLFSWLMKISHKTVFLSMTGVSLATLMLSLFFIKPGIKNKGDTTEEHGPTTLFRKREKAPT